LPAAAAIHARSAARRSSGWDEVIRSRMLRPLFRLQDDVSVINLEFFEVEVSEMILRRVGTLSLGKFMGFLYGLLGLLIGAVFSLISLLGFAAQNQGQGQGQAALLIGVGVGSIIIFPLLYGFLGFLGGIIFGALFNLVASMAGGIEIELIRGDEKLIHPRSEPLGEDPFRG
jgi:hypothetical protein